jgi:hypothetical protein
MDLKELDWEGLGCMHVAREEDQGQALANTAVEISGVIKCGKFLDQLRTY